MNDFENKHELNLGPLSYTRATALELDLLMAQLHTFNRGESTLGSRPTVYHFVLENLPNHFEIEEDCGLEEIFNIVGLPNLPEDVDVFLILEMPDKVIKSTLGQLMIHWEEVWNPPLDDGLLLCIPRQKTILLTHWNVVYYG